MAHRVTELFSCPDVFARLAGSAGASLVSFQAPTTGGILRSMEARILEWVSVKDYGAKGDGVTNDTTAINNALASGRAVWFPRGTYLCGAVTIQTSCREIAAEYGTIITATGSITASTSIFTATSNVLGLMVRGLTFNISTATYPTILGMRLFSCSNVIVRDCRAPTACGAGLIHGDTCTDVLVDNCTIGVHKVGAIRFVNANSRVRVVSCTAIGDNTAASHAISITGGAYNRISKCYVEKSGLASGGVFGATLITTAQGLIDGCIVKDNIDEGITLASCTDSTIFGSTIYCSASSDDFGINIASDVAATKALRCHIIGNTIYGGGKAGIALAVSFDDVLYCTVRGNTVYNCNTMNEAQWGGITVYGVAGVGNANHNIIANNHVYDDTGLVNYAANEWQSGAGSPNFNQLIDNTWDCSGLVSETLITGASSVTSRTRAESYVPVVTPTAGAITSYTINSATFRPRVKTMEIELDITITNNGTGSGALDITPPTGFAPATNGGVIPGAEIITGGLSVRGRASGPNIRVNTYDNLYPVTTNSRITLSGIYRIA